MPQGGAKTIADTNLTLPGQLPRGQAFEDRDEGWAVGLPGGEPTQHDGILPR